MESESFSDSCNDSVEELDELDNSFEVEESENDEVNCEIPSQDLIIAENWKRIPSDKYLKVQRNEAFPTPRIPIDETLDDPYNLFCHFFPNEMFELIATESNRYHDQYIELHPNHRTVNKAVRKTTWRDMTIETARGFIAIILLMGIVPRHYIRDHWKANPLLQSVVHKHIDRERFVYIWQFLHLYDNK